MYKKKNDEDSEGYKSEAPPQWRRLAAATERRGIRTADKTPNWNEILSRIGPAPAPALTTNKQRTATRQQQSSLPRHRRPKENKSSFFKRRRGGGTERIKSHSDFSVSYYILYLEYNLYLPKSKYIYIFKKVYIEPCIIQISPFPGFDIIPCERGENITLYYVIYNNAAGQNRSEKRTRRVVQQYISLLSIYYNAIYTYKYYSLIILSQIIYTALKEERLVAIVVIIRWQ